MPLDLSGALPQQQAQFTTTHVKSDYGIHDGFFVGLGQPFTETAFDACRKCKGKRTDENGAVCFVCDGGGRRIDKKVALIYDLNNGNREEEIVNYALTPPRQGKDGKPLSPSTLYLRFRAFSGLTTPEEINQWAATLPHQIRIPVQVVIEDNATGSALKISKVLKRNEGAAPQAQRRAPVQGHADGYSDDDFAGLERP